MLKTTPTKLWLFLVICAVLVNVRVVTAQTENAPRQGVKLYDDPRLLRWSADFLAGKREQALRSVEADLKSSAPHPFSAYVWVMIQYRMTGKEPDPADVKDEKLKRALGELPEVVKLYGVDENRELLRRYPAVTADRITDLWALQILLNIAIDEYRYDDAYLYAVRLAKAHPDHFHVANLIIKNLFDNERIRSKIIALFGKGGALGTTETGRLLQAELDSSLTNSREEEKESKFLEDWLKQFPNNIWALQIKARRLMKWANYQEAVKLLMQGDRAFPFTGMFLETSRVLMHDDKRQQAETLLRERALLMTKNSAVAADTSEELIAELLIDTHDSSTPERAESALAMLEKALARRPKSLEVLTLAAQAAAILESSEKMVKYAKRAFELAPDKRHHFVFLLSCLVHAKKYREAQALFTLGEKRYSQKSLGFWLLGAQAWLEYELEPGVTHLNSIKPEVWRIVRLAQQEYPEAASLLQLEGYLLNFVNRQTEGREKLKLSFTLSPPTPTMIKWLLRLQSELTVEEREAEFRELAKRYPSAAPELEKYIRRLELYVQTGSADVTSVAFSQDSRILATGTKASGIKLWDPKTGEEFNTLFPELTEEISCVAFSPDQKTVATSGSSAIWLWDISSTKQLLTMTDHTARIHSLAFSPDQKVLASGSEDKTVKLWSLTTGEVLRTLSHTVKVETVSFSPDGKTIAGSGSEITRLWATATGKELKTIDRFDFAVFLADGNLMIGRGIDQTSDQKPYYAVEILNVATGRRVRRMEGGYTEPFHFIALSPDNKMVAAAGKDSKLITVWEVATGRVLHKLSGHTVSIAALTFSADNRLLASVSIGGIAKLWDPVTGQELRSLGPRVSDSSSYHVSPDSKWTASQSFDAINLWDLAGNLGLTVLYGHTDTINSLAFSPNSSSLASASADGTVKLWALMKDEVRTFSGDKEKFSIVEFSPDGTWLAGSSFSRVNEKTTYSTQVWNLNSGRSAIRIINRSHDGAFGFSPNSKFLVTHGGPDPIQIWDLATGKELVRPKGQTSGAYGLRFSADSKFFASSFTDSEVVRFWDVQTGNELKYDAVPDWASSGKFYQTPRVSPTLKIKGNDAGLKLVDDNDQTVATLFAFHDGGWIVLDRDGRFDASPSAEKLMHYNYGLQIISLDQLKEMYYAPGLLPKLLGHNKERLPAVVSLKEIKLHPEIVSHQLSPDSTRLSMTLKNLGGGIGETRVLVNDKLVVQDARDAALKANPNIPVGQTVTLAVDLRGASVLKGKKNKITIITSNYLPEIGRGNIQSRGADILYTDSGKPETEMPSLYAIVGGISDYEGDQIDLRFAAKDAEDFSNALSLAARRLYCPQENQKCLDKVKIKTLSTARPHAEDQPTKENFRKAFAWVAQQAQPEDIVVIYLAGHGVTLADGTDSYFYLTKDARSASVENVAKVYQTTAISNTELTDWLTLDQKVPDDIFIKSQRQLIILDTCAAGNFAGDKAWNSARDLSGDQIRAMEFLRGKTGTFILMGSANSQPSYEASRFNQGLLTYALLEGMRGAALRPPASDVEVRLLLGWAEKRVPELAREMQLEQKPVIKQPAGNSFLVGKMNDEDRLQIKLPSLKPVLLRPRLSNPAEDNDDNLNLITELSKRLDLESSYEVMRRGGRGEPVFIYINEDSFPGAIRVTGSYTVAGETVRLKAFLRRDGLTIATLPEIAGAKETVLGKLVDAVRTALLRTRHSQD